MGAMLALVRTVSQQKRTGMLFAPQELQTRMGCLNLGLRFSVGSATEAKVLSVAVVPATAWDTQRPAGARGDKLKFWHKVLRARSEPSSFASMRSYGRLPGFRANRESARPCPAMGLRAPLVVVIAQRLFGLD